MLMIGLRKCFGGKQNMICPIIKVARVKLARTAVVKKLAGERNKMLNIPETRNKSTSIILEHAFIVPATAIRRRKAFVRA